MPDDRKVLHEFKRNAEETVRVSLSNFKGRTYIDIRLFYTDANEELAPTKKGITFAFSRGAEFEDKYGLLEGVGKVSKNVRIRRLKDLHKPALRYYIKQALAFDAEKRK